MSSMRTCCLCVPSSDGEQLEQFLLERNKAHYAQAKDTPFAQEPFLSDLGWDGTSPTCEQILDGTFNYDSLPNEETKEFVRQLKREDIPEIPADYPVEAFTRGLSKWPEKTSTSPSGHDQSQYKCLLMDIPESAVSSSTLVKLQHSLLLAALDRGIPYHR